MVTEITEKRELKLNIQLIKELLEISLLNDGFSGYYEAEESAKDVVNNIATFLGRVITIKE